MKKYYNKNERGVALLFALGMLALLLVLGLAFVANALLAQKTARNNSSRTQARMLANSALNRAMAAIMVYDLSYRMTFSTSPSGFGAIHSISNGTDVVEDSANPSGPLTGENSLLLLPEDDSLVAKSAAVQYNKLFTSNAFTGDWFYFYNGKSGSDKRIIGRAAWQVVSSAPPMLYPVFLRGGINAGNVDVNSNWKPSEHRWGRDIDEASFSSDTPLLKPAADNFDGNGGSSTSYDTFYNIVTSWTDEDKRWFETWFMPEPDPAKADIGRASAVPTALFADTYTFIRNKQRRNYMRFNISEFALRYDAASQAYKVDWKGNYSGNEDPWYARFGSGDTFHNNEEAIKNLTRDSADALPSDKFDHNVDAKERSGLPFLRLIGNDKGTFANLGDLRKQIAANFNDYCDADNIPTSNIAAENWWTLTDWNANKPIYTGNEKTPYLYELGFKIGLVQDGSAAPLSKGIKIGPVTTTAGSASYKINVPLSGALRVAPMVKLANIYKFDPAAGVNNLKAGVDLENLQLKVRLKFKIPKIVISYQEKVDGVNVTRTQDLNNWVFSSETDEEYQKVLEAVIPAAGSAPGHIVSFKDSEVKNLDGSKPYPLAVPQDNEEDKDAWRNLDIKSVTAALNITPALIREMNGKNGNSVTLPDTFEISTVTTEGISVSQLQVLSSTVKTGRVVLAGETNGKTSAGLDWVNPLELTRDFSADDFVLDFADAAKVYPALFLGGIRNYDPRQNLNAGDWKLDELKLGVSADFQKSIVAEVKTVMTIKEAETTDLIGVANGSGDFSPAGKTAEQGDKESATEPGATSSSFISTAFIRNAPMMSPWEIGFIHRGVKWQTINIKKAGSPNGSGVVKPEDFLRIGENKWDTQPGTSYAAGDGAVLEQIKMSDRSLGYGKVNVNMLRSNYFGFNAERDKNIVFALFNGLKKQSVESFFTESTRVDNKLPDSNTGESVNFNEFNAFVQDDSGVDSGYYNRVHFLHAKSSMFIELAGGSDKPDAQQEEIIGKVINLISAEEVSPSQIQVVIVAQSIDDKTGEQLHLIKPLDEESKTCEFGTYEENYDEITGEVKMFVVIDRAPSGKLTVRRIDYIE